MRVMLVLGMLVPQWAAGQARRVETAPSSETIGSWVLACAADPMTDRGDCTLRHRLWLEEPRAAQPNSPDPGRPGVGLEVLGRHGAQVPAVVARGLTMDSARLGLLAVVATAQLRFGRDPALDLPCALEGRSMVCVPRPDQAETAAAQLARAASVLVRISGPGISTETFALDLSGTQDAVARLRARMPDPPPPAASPTAGPAADLRSLLEQLFQGGASRN
jgi:hypothetical protein